MALGRLRRKRPDLELVFTGPCTEYHGRLIALSLERIEVLERQIAARDDQRRVLVEPLMPQIEQLVSIPGVDVTAVRDILGEIGTDMRRCDSAARVAS
jgi:transposase